MLALAGLALAMQVVPLIVEMSWIRVLLIVLAWGGLLLAVLMWVGGMATAGERSTGQVVDDALITTTVKASFAADPQVSALAIDVDTAGGVVLSPGLGDQPGDRLWSPH